MNSLFISNVSKNVNGNVVLSNIVYKQQQLKKVAIAGETGSGKSTLLKIVAGFLQPDEGEVWFNNERVLGPDEKLIPGHKAIAYLSQHFELRNNYRVEELLEMASKITNDEATQIYDVCKISHLLTRKTNQLSGGEKQRIALAQVLVTSPALLLLDEPFSNLDIIHKNILKTVINEISDNLKIGCIIVSHDPLDTLSWAEEIIIMKEGKIVQQGNAETIYKNPANEYVAGLFGSFNVISADLFKLLNKPNIEISGKNIITRPEDFSIVSNEKNALIAEIIKTSFYGSFYEIEVLVNETKIKIKTSRSSFSKGDVVYVSMIHDDNNSN